MDAIKAGNKCKTNQNRTGNMHSFSNACKIVATCFQSISDSHSNLIKTLLSKFKSCRLKYSENFFEGFCINLKKTL